MIIAVALRTAGGLLDAAPLPINEARTLLAHVLGVRREKLVAHPERVLTIAEFDAYEALLYRRSNGEPMAYVLGVQEFYSLAFRVTPAVLIPRPETESLVDLLRVRLAAHIAPRVLDLGTGSGCIAIAFATARPDATVLAVDVSEAALEVARDNAARHAAAVTFRRSDWYGGVDGRFDAIVANPPYVRDDDPHLTALGHEPRAALSGHADGLRCLRTVIERAPELLGPGGWLMVEHGHDQGAAVRALFDRVGLSDVETTCDLAGHERVCAGRWAGASLS